MGLQSGMSVFDPACVGFRWVFNNNNIIVNSSTRGYRFENDEN